MCTAAWQSCSSSLSRPVRSRPNTSATGPLAGGGNGADARLRAGAAAPAGCDGCARCSPAPSDSRPPPRPGWRTPARPRPGRPRRRPCAWVSRSGAFSGATSTSRDRPMVFIARAAEPMLPGCWVPTRTMRKSRLGGVGPDVRTGVPFGNGKLRAPAPRRGRSLSPPPFPFLPSEALRHAETRGQCHGQGGPRRPATSSCAACTSSTRSTWSRRTAWITPARWTTRPRRR